MSVQAVQQSASVPAVARDPKLLQALEVARAFNARPHREDPVKDTNFVRDVLGRDLAKAKIKKRELMSLLAAQNVGNRGGTPEEIVECNHAFNRLMTCTKAAWMPVEPAKPNPGMDAVIIMAASVAERGLAMADQGLKAAQAAWQRKVDDGTVDAVKGQVIERATDLLDFGRSLAQRGWAEAIRRTRGGKS